MVNSSSYSANRHIISDADDTVLACADVFQDYLEKEHGLYSELRLKDHYEMQRLFGLDTERILEIIAAFHRSACFATLPPLPCAAKVLPELHRAGYKFIAITACLDEPETIRMRRQNLVAAFGFEWEAVHCIGLSPCKRAALDAYPPSIWVDDLARHAVAGAQAGHRSFLIDKPYNRDLDHADVVRVVDWCELQMLL